ncbi:hypothetical protein A4A49_64042, partial [Nicotiana attenuata]
KLYPLKVETDATQVIVYINNGYITYDSIINTCMWSISRMGMIVTQHNFRQDNEVAHLLAKHATMLSSIIKLCRLVIPPPYVMTRMLVDKVEDVYVKSVSINSCRHLVKLGNQHAVHGLSSLCNGPQDHNYCS